MSYGAELVCLDEIEKSALGRDERGGSHWR